MSARRILAAALLSAAAVAAQSVYVGVKGGTPLSDSELTGVGGSRPLGGGPNRFVTRRYTVGPSAEVELPFFGLGVGVDALYERNDSEQQFYFNLGFGRTDRAYWNSWKFPIVLRREWRSHGHSEPFRRFVHTKRLGGGLRSPRPGLSRLSAHA